MSPPPMLFRRESLASRETAWLGQPTLSLAPPVRMITLVCCLFVAALLGLVIDGSYARRVDLHGTLEPASGLIEITSPQRGSIVTANAVNDRTVHAGDLLYVVNVDTATSGGETQQRILRALRRQRILLESKIVAKQALRAAKQQALRKKVDNLRAQIAQAATQIEVEAAFTAVLRAQYSRYSAQVRSGISTMNDLQVREQAWMHAKDSLEQLKNSRLTYQAQLTEAEYQLHTIDPETASELDAIRGQLLDTDRQIAASEARGRIEIRAPAAGTVTSVIAHAGQTVAASAPLLTIVPSQHLQADLLAPSSAIGFIKPGQRVMLRYSAFPYQKFGQYWGTITRVSLAAVPTARSRQPAPAGRGARINYYQVLVKPDQDYVKVFGRKRALRASMQLQAYVLLENRPIYQWILEPLYGLRGSI